MTHHPSIRDFKNAVAHAFEVSLADLTARDRTARHVVPRQVLCGLLREVPGMSYPRIGAVIDRDHTTAMSNAKRFPALIADPIYGPQIEVAREALAGGKFRSGRKKGTAA